MTDTYTENIKIYPTATKTDNLCFPCLAVEVMRSGQRPLKTWIDLRTLGEHFETLDQALDAARQVRVISVSNDGKIKWESIPR